MKIALIGYGKMGKTIEKIAKERGHSVVLIIDKNNQQDFTKENIQKAQVAIEFSTPDTALSNYIRCFQSDIPVVSGTTGWLEKKEEVENWCKEKAKFFYASNFSLGVNLFFHINKYVANLMQAYDNYRCEVEEIHHIHKLDAPSGTAITIAEDILKNMPQLGKWENSTTTDLSVLPIESKREGDVPGIHTVSYTSSEDILTIKHEAKGREGFALGAVLAAEFLVDKSHGWFSMNDLLNLNE